MGGSTEPEPEPQRQTRPELGQVELTANGQTFTGFTEDYGDATWLVVGRGREGWTWEASGVNPDQVTQDLGTAAAFAPAYYSTDFINALISDAGSDLQGVEIRLKRASHNDGSDYEQAMWRPSSETAWRWDFDNAMDVVILIIIILCMSGHF